MEMKYKELIDVLTVIAIGSNILEKFWSYIGQKTFPQTIFEGNVYTAWLLQQSGLEVGHIIAFAICFSTVFLYRYAAIYAAGKVQQYRKLQKALMCIPICALLAWITFTMYVAVKNIYLIWINLI